MVVPIFAAETVIVAFMLVPFGVLWTLQEYGNEPLSWNVNENVAPFGQKRAERVGKRDLASS